jgi:hypothetical protein
MSMIADLRWAIRDWIIPSCSRILAWIIATRLFERLGSRPLELSLFFD